MSSDAQIPYVLLVRQAFAAAKNGQRARALPLLTQVVEIDPDNATAWWWLSQVVDTVADQRLCLENVLTLEPENSVARDALARLPAGPEADLGPTTQDDAALVDEPAGSPASTDTDPPSQPTTTIPIAYQPYSSYDDVWTQGEDLCGYCATPVATTERRCSNCRRNLIYNRYIYPRRSRELWLFIVFLIMGAQLYIYQTLQFFIDNGVSPLLVWRGFILATLAACGIGVYLRQRWGWATALIFLPLLLAELLLGWRVDLPALGFANLFDLDAWRTSAISSGGSIIGLLTAVPLSMALFFAIFRIPADFQRREFRWIARELRGRHDAATWYRNGREHAAAQRWAMAVRSYQRAVGADPTQIGYQRDLGRAYAELGFYQRSLDTLRHAKQSAIQTESQQLLATLIADVEEKAARNSQ